MYTFLKEDKQQEDELLQVLNPKDKEPDTNLPPDMPPDLLNDPTGLQPEKSQDINIFAPPRDTDPKVEQPADPVNPNVPAVTAPNPDVPVEPNPGDAATAESDVLKAHTQEDDNKKKLTKEKTRKQLHDKIIKSSHQAVSAFKSYINKRSKDIIGDFNVYGIEETIKRFLKSYYIPNIKDQDEQVFMSLNLEQIAKNLSDKLKEQYVKTDEF